jgi:DNA-binding transcriptional ArsR family regulator
VRDFAAVCKAAGDPTRARILKLLEDGGLCGCQIQAVLGLAPSTVSKHLAILKMAGLVTARRDGKWIEYSLVQDAGNPYAEPVLAMLRGPIDQDPTILADRRRLDRVRSVSLPELCEIGPRHVGRIMSRRHAAGWRPHERV